MGTGARRDPVHRARVHPGSARNEGAHARVRDAAGAHPRPPGDPRLGCDRPLRRRVRATRPVLRPARGAPRGREPHPSDGRRARTGRPPVAVHMGLRGPRPVRRADRARPGAGGAPHRAPAQARPHRAHGTPLRHRRAVARGVGRAARVDVAGARGPPERQPLSRRRALHRRRPDVRRALRAAGGAPGVRGRAPPDRRAARHLRRQWRDTPSGATALRLYREHRRPGA
jgi:hypothetical protein